MSEDGRESDTATTIQNLRRELGPLLKSGEQVAARPGLPTGWDRLDKHLIWGGLPKGALSLFVSDTGGSTSLWLNAAAKVTQAGQWAAWVDDPDRPLSIWGLQRARVDRARFLLVSRPQDRRQLLWALQELMSLCLFETVACNLPAEGLRTCDLLRLKNLAARHQTALVLLTRTPVAMTSAFALVLRLRKDSVRIERALHRPTHILERRELYADTLPLLAAGRRPLCG